MRKKGVIIFVIIAVLIVAGIFIIAQVLKDSPWEEEFFDPGNRYQWNRLDYMDVIFENESDVGEIRGCWSSTMSCPWIQVHEGFDFAMKNNSKVLAAAPGQVSDIYYKEWINATQNKYMVEIVIRFNHTVYVSYNFEPWTTKVEDYEHQKRLIHVSVGDWVEIGQEIGRLLNISEDVYDGGHIHFAVLENDISSRLDRYYSPEAYDRMMALVHQYHPEWPYLCYDDTTPLDYVNTTFISRDSIHDVQNAYSNTNDCPWGYVHKGFDFYFINNRRVYNAAPGFVKTLELIDRGEGINRYALNITMEFNDIISVEYIFEIWSNNINDYNTQLSKIYIEEGNWYMMGWPIGDFHQANSSSYVHFAIRENGDYPPLDKYFGSIAHDIMMNLIHDYHPTWDYLCYTG